MRTHHQPALAASRETNHSESLEELTRRVEGGGDWTSDELHCALGPRLWRQFKAEKAVLLPRPAQVNLAGELITYTRLIAKADRLHRAPRNSQRVALSRLAGFKRGLYVVSAAHAYELAQELLGTIAAGNPGVVAFFDRPLTAPLGGAIAESPESVPRLHYSRSPYTKTTYAERCLVVSLLRQAGGQL